MNDKSGKVYGPINRAIIAFLIRCYTQGHVHVIHPGDIDTVKKLAAYTQEDLDALEDVHFPVLPSIIYDSESLTKLLSVGERRNAERHIKDRLLTLEAPAPLLFHLFGMVSADFATRRKALGLATQVGGRPRSLTEDEETTLAHLWSQNREKPEHQRWIEVAEAHIPLASAWTAIQRWNTGVEDQQQDCIVGENT